ncbi:MAG: hypothetical protein AB1898_28620 [Acidobacteriota bacterium]
MADDHEKIRVTTHLTDEFAAEILRQTGTGSLAQALNTAKQLQ